MDIWNIIDNNENNFDELFLDKNFLFLINKNFIIDLNKLQKSSSQTTPNYFEKFIVDIANFHIDRLNYSIDDVYIEFLFCNKEFFDNKFHNDSSFKSPINTSITYFKDNSYYPTVITNITSEKYKFKKFYNEDMNVFFIFPVKNKHISFDNCDNFYGNINISNDPKNSLHTNEIELIIRIWKEKPDCPYFDYNEFFSKITPSSTLINDNSFSKNIIIPSSDITRINIKNEKYINILSFDFFDNLFYNFNLDIFKDVNQLFSGSNNFLIIYTDEKEYNTDTITQVNNNFKTKCELIFDLFPKFNQRLILKKYYNSDICSWIIDEINSKIDKNMKWENACRNIQSTNDSHSIGLSNNIMYKYCLAEKFEYVFNFILISIKNILEIIENYYTIQNFYYNVFEILFIKYDSDIMKDDYKLSYFKSDNSSMIIKILLSDENNYIGGKVVFEDEIENNFNQGDMIIHNGTVKYYEENVSSGDKIYLVIKLKLFNKNCDDSSIYIEYLRNFNKCPDAFI